MLTTRRKSWRHAWCCSVLENGTRVADLPEFVIGGLAYKARWNSGWLHPSYVLEQDGLVVARAWRPSWFVRTLHVASGEEQYALKAKFLLARTFVLCDGDRAIGLIRPESWFGLNAVADLPQAIPLPVRVYALADPRGVEAAEFVAIGGRRRRPSRC